MAEHLDDTLAALEARVMAAIDIESIPGAVGADLLACERSLLNAWLTAFWLCWDTQTALQLEHFVRSSTMLLERLLELLEVQIALGDRAAVRRVMSSIEHESVQLLAQIATLHAIA
ncbi:MAG TPA: hypothetical protein VGM82_00995 [Gemmatimonadaceae bacterium]|jgi:hypothetical protein